MEINAEELLAILEPKWQPDIVHARQVLDDRLNQRKKSIAPWMLSAAAAGVFVALGVLPQSTRGIAQELWERLVLKRVEVVRVDFSKLPLDTHINTNGLGQKVRDAVEAEKIAGFTPFVPTGVLSGTPEMAVMGTIVADQTIHIRDLEAALRQQGVADVQVPPEWEGISLRTVIGPMVSEEYPGNIEIVQSPPFAFTLPSGFPLERFAEVAFRSIGVPAQEAGTMARKFAANPAWLLDIPSNAVVGVQELTLTSGPALLIEEFDHHTGAVAKDTVIRTTANRVYAVESPTRDLSVKIAGSLP